MQYHSKEVPALTDEPDAKACANAWDAGSENAVKSHSHVELLHEPVLESEAKLLS